MTPSSALESVGDTIEHMARPKKTTRTAKAPEVPLPQKTKTPDLHKTPVVGFRIPSEVLREFDAYVAELNAKAEPGFSTSRNALVIELMRKAVKTAHERRLTDEKGTPHKTDEDKPS